VFPAEACLLPQNITLCTTLTTCGEGAEEELSDYAQLDGYNLSIEMSVPISPITFWIAALNVDGEQLKLPISSEICGYEEITAAISGTLLIGQTMIGDALFVEIPLETLFINDSPENYCPIVSFSLTESAITSSPPGEEILQYLSLNETHLWVSADIQESLVFSIMAETDLGKRGWKQIRVSLDPCDEQGIDFIEEELTFEVNKNSGMVWLLNDTLIDANFILNTYDLCFDRSFELVDAEDFNTSQPYPIYEDGELYMNSSMSLNETDPQLIIHFRIRGFVDNGDFESYSVQVIVGCFNESTLSALTFSLNPYFHALSDNEFKFILPTQGEARDDPILDFPLRRTIQFEADQNNCFASRVLMCQDAECVTPLSVDSLYLEDNPSIKDEDGIVRPQLGLNSSDLDLVMEVFIMGQASNSSVNDTIRGVIAICGNVITVNPVDVNSTLLMKVDVPDVQIVEETTASQEEQEENTVRPRRNQTRTNSTTVEGQDATVGNEYGYYDYDDYDYYYEPEETVPLPAGTFRTVNLTQLF